MIFRNDVWPRICFFWQLNKDVKHGMISTAHYLGRLLILQGLSRYLENGFWGSCQEHTRVLGNRTLQNRINSKIHNLAKTYFITHIPVTANFWWYSTSTIFVFSVLLYMLCLLPYSSLFKMISAFKSLMKCHLPHVDILNCFKRIWYNLLGAILYCSSRAIFQEILYTLTVGPNTILKINIIIINIH